MSSEVSFIYDFRWFRFAARSICRALPFARLADEDSLWRSSRFGKSRRGHSRSESGLIHSLISLVFLIQFVHSALKTASRIAARWNRLKKFSTWSSSALTTLRNSPFSMRTRPPTAIPLLSPSSVAVFVHLRFFTFDNQGFYPFCPTTQLLYSPAVPFYRSSSSCEQVGFASKFKSVYNLFTAGVGPVERNCGRIEELRRWTEGIESLIIESKKT